VKERERDEHREQRPVARADHAGKRDQHEQHVPQAHHAGRARAGA
jgi:hypothetical protein